MAESGEMVRRSRTGVLPHGIVPMQHISDPQARDAVMKLNENIVALAEHVKTLRLAVQELQRR